MTQSAAAFSTALPTGSNSASAELTAATLAAFGRSQAIIEFQPDGTIITANANFLGAVGYSLDQVSGKLHRMFCDPAYARAPEYSDFWASLRRGEFIAGEFQRVASGGREIYLMASYNPVTDASGAVVKVVKIASNITGRKLQEKALASAQATVEFTLDGILLTANSKFQAALGYDLAEAVGKHHRIFCDPEYVATPAYAQLWSRLRSGETVSGEFKRLRKDKSIIWLSASYTPTYDDAGKLVKMVKYASDITDKVKIRVALKELAQALSSSSTELSSSAQQSAAAAEQTTRQMETVAAATEQADRNVGVVAASATEMASSIDEISRNMQKAKDISGSAVKMAETTNTTIAKLGDSSQKIGKVVKLITSIAQQTNLLALNATIEAARAGEAGKGFAVVANEVKELAKQTARATDEISAQIDAIQADTKHSVEAIQAISTIIGQMNQISTAVAAATSKKSPAGPKRSPAMW